MAQRNLKAVPVESANEKRAAEIREAIKEIENGKRPIPPNAYSTENESYDHRRWPLAVVLAFGGDDNG